jgi:uncharacterized beta-barrel protein YwiB (DUF1934 family)
MRKNVVISLVGVQRYDETPPDVIELVTQGQLHEEDGVLVLSYEESELTGLEGTRTTLRIEGERVVMLREGELNTQMIFEEGQRHLSLYETPYGTMSIGVRTWSLFVEMDSSGGELEMDYAVEVEHSIAGRNTFRIEVREVSSKKGRENDVEFDSEGQGPGGQADSAGL